MGGSIRYTSKAKQGEPVGCLADAVAGCRAGFACEGTAAMSEERWRCLRREVLLDKPTPRREERFVVVRQASFGMVNSFRGGMTAGLLVAALTSRRVIMDWPDVVRNFGATAPARLYPAREPKAYEWWRGVNSTATWSESGMERRDDKGAVLEEVKLERVREADAARFVEVQSGATSLPMSPGAVDCAARLFGSRSCAANVRCVQGAAYRVMLAEPTPHLAAAMRAHGLPPDDDPTTVVGMHLRSWPTAMEGDDGPPRKVPIDDWATLFFDCAARALQDLRGPTLLYFATDNPDFRANASARFGADRLRFAPGDVTHTRTAPKRGATKRSNAGGDTAVLDWFTLADASHVFVGTRASTFSDAIIDRGCLGRLRHFWQLGSAGDCRRTECASALNLH